MRDSAPIRTKKVAVFERAGLVPGAKDEGRRRTRIGQGGMRDGERDVELFAHHRKRELRSGPQARCEP